MKNIFVWENLREVEPAPTMQTNTTKKSQDAVCLMLSVRPKSLGANRNLKVSSHVFPISHRTNDHLKLGTHLAGFGSAQSTRSSDIFEGRMVMLRKKILWASIVGIALVGAVFGALAIRSARNEAVTSANTSDNPTQVSTQPNSTVNQSTVDNKAAQPETPKVATASSPRRYSNGRSAYYDYNNQPQNRTFWQKHRDKLTVAGGAGAGALVGGLIGGKKGAGIGLLGGGASSALYTYKLRHKRTRQ